MLVYGKCEWFVMQMLYVCVLCASCGSSQCCVLHEFSSFIWSINVFPVSMIVSPKGSVEYCFLYASYMLFDSSVRPGMFDHHPLGMCFLDAILNISTNRL